jgi:NCS1 family nucleobase:cation symporter-1
MKPADISAVAPAGQTQSALDLFLIFVGANIVATTFQVGASLAASFTVGAATVLVAIGSVIGALLVGGLAPLGSRLGVPSVIATRPALGMHGAAAVAALLYGSNFAWIALNNVIAASACAHALGGSEQVWAIVLGLLATFVVWVGPRAVALADRIAVPVLLGLGVALTVACLRVPYPATPVTATILSWSRGLDVVVGYQVSWILMFADYSRYTRSARASGIAVFLALASTSIWLMPLGTIAARAAGSGDPGAMFAAVGLGIAGAALLALATLTTNFVNIYMSALAWRSLLPRTRDSLVVWSIGIVGTLLSAVPGVWLQHYAHFMMLLGAVLIPVGGVLIAHYYLTGDTFVGTDGFIAALYDASGPYRGINAPGMAAWGAGAIAYFLAGPIGGTLPAFAVSILVYLGLRRTIGPTRP